MVTLTARTSMFGITFAIISIFVLVLFKRRKFVKAVLVHDPDPEFVRGFEKACEDMEVQPMISRGKGDDDVIKASVDQMVLVTDRPAPGALCPMVTFGHVPQARLPPRVVHNISYDAQVMLDKAVDTLPAIKNPVLVVQTLDQPELTLRRGLVQVRTTPSKALYDILDASRERPVDAVIVMHPSLNVPYSARDMLASELIPPLMVSCGYNDQAYDVRVFQHAYEQGYLTAVLANNLLDNRALYRDTQVHTKIYIDVKDGVDLGVGTPRL